MKHNILVAVLTALFIITMLGTGKEDTLNNVCVPAAEPATTATAVVDTANTAVSEPVVEAPAEPEIEVEPESEAPADICIICGAKGTVTETVHTTTWIQVSADQLRALEYEGIEIYQTVTFCVDCEALDQIDREYLVMVYNWLKAGGSPDLLY